MTRPSLRDGGRGRSFQPKDAESRPSVHVQEGQVHQPGGWVHRDRVRPRCPVDRERLEGVAPDVEGRDDARLGSDVETVPHGIEVQDVGIVADPVGVNDPPALHVEDAEGGVGLAGDVDQPMWGVQVQAVAEGLNVPPKAVPLILNCRIATLVVFSTDATQAPNS